MNIALDNQRKWRHHFPKKIAVNYLGFNVLADRKYITREKRNSTGEYETYYCIADESNVSMSISQELWNSLDLPLILVEQRG